MRLKIRSCSFRSLLSGLVLVLLLSACGGQEQEDDGLRIGVTLYTQDDTFISSMSQNLERLAREAESETGIKITLLISDSRHNQTTQMDQVDRFLSRGCSILCVNMVDRTGAAVIVDKAEAEGVLYPEAEGGARVVFSQPQRAVTAGQSLVCYLGDAVAGGGTICRAE